MTSCAGAPIPGQKQLQSARAQVAKGDWGAAFADYEKAISLQVEYRKENALTGPAPAAAMAFVKRARALAKHRMPDAALANYELAWELHLAEILLSQKGEAPSPSDPGHKSSSARRKGLFLESEAWEAIKRARQKTRTQATTGVDLDLQRDTLQYLVEAVMFKRKGRPDLARAEVDKALAADPANQLALEIRNSITGDSKQTTSLQNRQKAEKLVDEGLDAYLDGRIAHAKKLWNRALELDPENGRARNNLTRVKLEK